MRLAGPSRTAMLPWALDSPRPPRPEAAMATTRPRRPVRLTVDPLEDRAVPANNLTITGDPTSFHVAVSQGGPVVQVWTTGPDARLSLATLYSSLMDSQVTTVNLTTAAIGPDYDAQQAGNISWPAAAGDLLLPDLAGRKTLNFLTVAGANAVGNMDLTGVRVRG